MRACRPALGLSLSLFLAFLAPADLSAQAEDRLPSRIVSIGGAVTETLFALDAGDRIVARDSTSTFPDAARSLPDAGYMRALSAEGVLSTNPDMVIAIEGSGPPDQLAILKASGVRIETVPEGHDVAAIDRKIRAIGHLVGKDAAAEALSAKTRADLDTAAKASQRPESARKRVLFVLSLQDGKIMAAGAHTSAEAIITLAGGTNALGGMEGYKAVTPEALIDARPDIVLMMARGGLSVSPESVFANPALALTPAAATQSLVVMDGLTLLGFGPRTAEAIRQLSAALYGPHS